MQNFLAAKVLLFILFDWFVVVVDLSIITVLYSRLYFIAVIIEPALFARKQMCVCYLTHH